MRRCHSVTFGKKISERQTTSEMTRNRRRHNFHNRTTNNESPRRLTEEEIKRIKYDPNEFDRLGLSPKSLENFIILDGSSYLSFFFQCGLFNDIEYYGPSTGALYGWDTDYIGSATVTLKPGKGSVTNITVYITPHAKHNVISVKQLRCAKLYIDLKNFTIRNRWNEIVCKIISIGSQFCIRVDCTKPGLGVFPTSIVEEQIDKINLHYLFCHIDITIIKKLIKSKEIRGLSLNKNDIWDKNERVKCEYCENDGIPIGRIERSIDTPFKDMFIQIIEDQGMITNILNRRRNNINYEIQLMRRVIIFTCCNTGYRFLFNISDLSNQISQINRCIELVINKIKYRMPRNKIKLFRIPANDDYLNMENESLNNLLEKNHISMIIHKPNEHCYKYQYLFSIWEELGDFYHMLPETNNYSYIDADNKRLIKEANILFFELDFPEPLWYYCLQNIIDNKNQDINLAMTPYSQSNIKSFGSIVHMKGYQKNDVIYLGSIMNKAKYLVWIKSEKIIKIVKWKKFCR